MDPQTARAVILRHAEHLVDCVRKGRLNASAVYGLLEGYLETPGFAPRDRKALHALAMEWVEGR